MAAPLSFGVLALCALPWYGACFYFLGFDSVTLGFGLGCLFVQCLLTAMYGAVLPEGPWRAVPGFTAHQSITLPLYAYVAYVGVSTWWSDDPTATSSPFTRVAELHPVGAYLAKVTAGTMLLWDIPTSSAVESLCQPAVMVHHLLMGGLAVLGLNPPLFQWYLVFFFGVIELSGIPLQIVDVFHPRQTEWVAFAEENPTIGGLGAAARALFALLYLVVRMALFPAVMFGQLLPDAWTLLTAEKLTRPVSHVSLWVVMGSALVLTALQFYWGTLILRQIYKMLSGGASSRKATKSD
jgi:hypothetical protein